MTKVIFKYDGDNNIRLLPALLYVLKSTNIMEKTTGTPSRKKFIFWGAAIFSSFTLLKFWNTSKKKKEETVKMLTQDGRLVEINKNILPQKGKKISISDLQDWVKK